MGGLFGGGGTAALAAAADPDSDSDFAPGTNLDLYLSVPFGGEHSLASKGGRRRDGHSETRWLPLP